MTVDMTQSRPTMTVNPLTISNSETVAKRFPGVHVLGVKLSFETLTNVSWEAEIEQLHQRWIGKSRSDVLNSVKQQPYAEFMTALGLKVKKNPPSVANLITRCLTNEAPRLPRINPIVDAVNVAALQTEVSLGVFDAACVEGELQLSFSRAGESFLGLGAEKAEELADGLMVLRDQKKILSIFSVRDSQAQAISEKTKTVWLLACQVPGVSRDDTVTGLMRAVHNLEMIRDKHD
ncbi:B3/B4 domain-containing protein [Reinekea forsetii]|jgi:DNA/RNA-binding domain of Phe-tRNA-synthetase-like protein|nr:phenylalanine--tRNA ligase beta subunit-related protein [Reinekea forsetii]